MVRDDYYESFAEDADREIERRTAMETNKAFTKYGPDALDPEGHPAFDVLEHAMNEVIGLIRYADCIKHRANRRWADNPMAHRAAMRIAAGLDEFGKGMGRDMVTLVRYLRHHEMETGKTEHEVR